MSASAKVIKPISFLIVGLIVTLTLMSVKRAMAATLTPNAAVISYNLATGTTSGAIFPLANGPTFVMGTCTSLGFRGVGQVSILRIGGSFLEWVGLNSPSSATITSGFSSTAGTKIVQIDFSGGVNLVVNNADSFVVSNSSGANRTGVVTMIW